jgi:poly(3-hydroxyalkanoate) synthetase
MGRGDQHRQNQSESAGPPPSPVMPFLWPLLTAASATAAMASSLAGFARSVEKYNDGAELAAPVWASSNRVLLELASMRLRDFSTQTSGSSTVLCAPYALHEATVADFAKGYSIVEALSGAGLGCLFVTDWRSATPEMRYFSIDSYLADLNVAVDTIKKPVDLIGLCQGGWLALIYAARFPEKVRRLVLVGAPVDTRASASPLSRMARDTPIGAFENLVQLGESRVLGKHVLESWGALLTSDDIKKTLQIPTDIDPVVYRKLDERFQSWNAATVDLPGTYYLQVIRWLYKENQIAEGNFVALGRRISLADIAVPMFLLAARDDELVSPEQLFAIAQKVKTPKSFIEMVTEPCSHLSLFLGRKTLAGAWQRIGQWLNSDLSILKAS